MSGSRTCTSAVGHTTGRSLRIGELAELTGASVRSLRYYEQCGLLSSARTTGGQRRYGDDAVWRVQLVRNLLAAGLSVDGITAMLPCARSGTVTTAVLERLQTERERLDARFRDLSATRERLDELIVLARERVAVDA